ncbi:hypothetical protein A2697_04700 [Candidatus Curtissbacteria bacterium RIFCSPHIGHO2_01_FULL_41_44]|uniref:Type II toxin-antitoxin system RelE/ParE family toxin n=1 Tax=Candidatus Curtissbacteria bacterium RIFCSPLOWO2_01_FULL_42_50 TaxID=1797730 RepID=A0A1F5H2R3_9BACT|nr:MAG: hypothetical protein A3C33_01805 [Candidatus Curtissbacteria bacterium RIFCSPHIGHO2_02_FULL_42_58]OGD94791.1 MAG: hypothetical protein A2697_04700 [Candidatus Curtissbacteria bacterium RIFCSPHIGHO2_01_FULL_41_44]OGD96334.1 MAG: hypothetical protein A3E71_02160 [Candidatus Curtissbacteria bacterium RIFCSPHIGHO2_12_FULL_42_33]OGD98354.1 MAG: hypothetical protein A3B54_00680 [Candidatus Curtissbacteria bacterium RIFCSPLOWO2_01_FULL_42_50]OGE02991.1 MAG: hypothetical protein A3G16_04670 [Ca
MGGYQNTERKVIVLPEAEDEARRLRLKPQLERLVERLRKRSLIKGFKKIEPKTANTWEARLKLRWRAYIIFDDDIPTIFRVGDHL